MQAIPREQLLTLNLDVASTVATTIGCLPKVMPLRAKIVAEVSGFDLRNLDMLETYAMALMHAQAEFQASTAPAEPIDELSAELTVTRDLLFKDVTALEARNLVEFRATEMSGASGYKNLTKDVLLLCSVLRNNWSKIEGRTAVTLEDLDTAELQAKRLLAAVGTREQSPKGSVQQAEWRQRAFTLFARAHDEVRRIVTYLRWHEDDANTIFPTVFGGRNKQRTERPEPQPIAPPGNGGSIVTPPAPGATPAPTNGSAAIGMPGSSPLEPQK
ncbi:MAG: hypothetical protein JNL21_34910 [Myxococcales bacterium]|nr:hypothetical protein [Myxococcales bacterium]